MAIKTTVVPDTVCNIAKGTTLFDTDIAPIRNASNDVAGVPVISVGPRYVGISDPRDGELVFVAKSAALDIRRLPAPEPTPPTIEQAVQILFTEMAAIVIAQAKGD